MDVKGDHIFKVSKQKLWEILMNPDVLAKLTPGVTTLETVSEDSYRTTSKIKIGPVKGSFKGNLSVLEKKEPNTFAIEMEQLSKIGNAHVRVDMLIEEAQDGQAKLIFDGKAKLSGIIARTGQRVLSAVANTLTKEVFSALEGHIAESGDTTAPSDNETST